MAGIGFFIAGVPGAGLLALADFFSVGAARGATACLAARVPVAFPSKAPPAGAFFMLIWGVGVSSVDNFVSLGSSVRGARCRFC